MRTSPGLHVEWVDDEAVVLQPDGQLHFLNSSAALILALIEEHGFEKAIEEIKRIYVDEPNLSEQISSVLEELRAKGILQDD